MGLIAQARLMGRGRDWLGRARTPRSAQGWEAPVPRKEFPTGWARTPVAGALRTGLRTGVLRPVVWTRTAPVVEGVERLDGLRGPAVLVANHASHLDAPLILGSLPRDLARRVAVGAAADYFFDARWRALVTTLVFNAFPVERHGSNRIRSLAPVLLDRGWSLLLFPESTRSPDGWMAPFRLGAAHLCCQHGIPAVPVALRGTYAAMPRGRRLPLPGRPRVVVRYGRPLWPEADEGARAFGARLGTAVARLWVEEDLGWYRALRTEPRVAVESTHGPRDAARWRRVWESTRPLDGKR
jgi:1-acyl-sn-glycerol-3-phosphate acyltransferase